MTHSPPAVVVFLFFLMWRLSRAHQFHSAGQGQSTVSQRAEATVGECSLGRQVACEPVFVIGCHTPDSTVSPLRLHLVKCVCVFICNRSPALLVE